MLFQIKVGKKKKSNDVTQDNIIEGTRARTVGKEDSPAAVPETSPDQQEKVSKVKKYKYNIGDIVSVSPKLFDGKKPGSFSKANPERQFGVIKRVWKKKKIVQVE